MSRCCPILPWQSTIKNLEKKAISEQVIGNMYLYKPAVEEDNIKNSLITNM